MINKRFLIPVLALMAFGLPAGASIATYCSGSGCNLDTNAQFLTDLATDGYTLQGLVNFSTFNGSLAGDTYTDGTGTGVTFADLEGKPLSYVGTSVATPAVFSGPNYFLITLPSTIAAIQLSVSAQGGICLDAYCPAISGPVTNGFVGFINPDPGAQWTAAVGVNVVGNSLQINDFFVAPAVGANNPASTPEVGTVLLIGFGLIVMRWMKRRTRRSFRNPLTA